MKFSIERHEEMLVNNKRYVAEMRELVRRHQERLEQAEVDLAHYIHQIEEAKRLGKDGFDRDRFLKKREKGVLR